MLLLYTVNVKLEHFYYAHPINIIKLYTVSCLFGGVCDLYYSKCVSNILTLAAVIFTLILDVSNFWQWSFSNTQHLPIRECEVHHMLPSRPVNPVIMLGCSSLNKSSRLVWCIVIIKNSFNYWTNNEYHICKTLWCFILNLIQINFSKQYRHRFCTEHWELLYCNRLGTQR